MKKLAVLLAGFLFGAGLTVAEMTNPAKVLAFLDITGNWDPSLALVMASALIISAIGYLLKGKMHKPVCANSFSPLNQGAIDIKLLSGSVLFGIGWGLVGLCPGPAIAALSYASPELLTFVAAMLVGMFVTKALTTHKNAS